MRTIKKGVQVKSIRLFSLLAAISMVTITNVLNCAEQKPLSPEEEKLEAQIRELEKAGLPQPARDLVKEYLTPRIVPIKLINETSLLVFRVVFKNLDNNKIVKTLELDPSTDKRPNWVTHKFHGYPSEEVVNIDIARIEVTIYSHDETEEDPLQFWKCTPFTLSAEQIKNTKEIKISSFTASVLFKDGKRTDYVIFGDLRAIPPQQ